MRKTALMVAMFISSCACAQLVQSFSLINVIDGKAISLEDFSSGPGVVIIFTSNHCPYDSYYLDRMKSLTNLYKNKIPVVLINSHSDENESAEHMKSYADRCKLSMPYLADKEQKVFANLTPRKSPECFLLQNKEGKFSVVYRGAIDDNPQTASEVKHSYLKDAIDRLLDKQVIETPDVRPVGCSIRKN